jgi:hypothetical protein
MLTCAHVKDDIKKVRYVPFNDLDAHEIHRRQADATIKRGTVRRNGVCVGVQAVRVACVSSCDYTKITPNLKLRKKKNCATLRRLRPMPANLNVKLRWLVHAARHNQSRHTH